jgi:hypothetical protein
MSSDQKHAGETPRYISYLLRLWKENDDTQTDQGAKALHWRASLENPRTGERRGFCSLMEMFQFLWGEATGACGVDSLSDRSGEGGDAGAN